MTQEEKRIKLAEACGWDDISEPYSNEPEWTGIPRGEIFRKPLPDYLNDLNAVHEAEKLLTYEQWHEYRESLRTVVVGEIRLISQWCKADIHATAAQRAEALGLTLNLWTA